MNSPAVELRGVCVEAAGTRIAGPLDLTVAPGEHLLLTGPSGCGKSTLLRAVAGLARPTAGEVHLFGELASRGPKLTIPPAKRGIGILFQGGALWPHMSAARTLEFVLRARRTPQAEIPGRIRELLEWVELSGYEERMPGTLSGGEAQRLALARALAVRPRLLLLDEPLGPLDAELRGALLTRLADLQRQFELTVIHVTHDPDEARELATRTLGMRAGRIESAEAEVKA